MKKIAILSALFTIMSLSVQAQSQFRFGFQLSPTFSWFSSGDNQVNSNGTNLGLRLGLVGEYYFQENYALFGGLGFAFNQGGEILHDQGGNFLPNSELSDPDANRAFTRPEDAPLPDGSKVGYNLQYVEIPLGLKLRTNEFGYIRYFGEFQILTIGINTQARGSINTPDSSFDLGKENISDDVNFLNLSWGIGGGIEYAVSESTSLVGGLAFQAGYIDVTKDGVNADGSTEDARNPLRSITVRLGVLF